LLLGVFILLKNKKSAINLTFFLVCLVTFWWQFSWFILFNLKDPVWAGLIVRIGYAGIILIPVTFFHFFLNFLEINNKSDRYFLYLYYLISAAFEISLFTTNLFVSGYYHYSWGYYPKVSLLHPIYLLLLVIISFRIIYLLYLFLHSKGKVAAYKYPQAKYLLVALIFYTLSASDFLINYGIEFYPLGFIFILIFLGIIGYTIARYRLMDIRIVMRQAFVYVGLVAFTYASFYLIATLYFDFFGEIYSLQGFILGLFVAPIFVTILFGVNRGLLFIANRFFFYSLYNYQETISRMSRQLNNSIDLQKIIDLIVDTIKSTMFLERAGVLLVDQAQTPVFYRIAKVIGFNEKNGISLVQDNFLTQYLEKTQKPLVLDELDQLARDARLNKDKKSFEQLRTNMQKIEASLCLPLLLKNKLIGIIVLGGKISGDAYSKEDLGLLTNLSYQASIAIENARLYQEVKDFNKTLKQKVDEQTKDLRNQAEHLKKLLKMRSEFLDIASHQLKTPVSVILGTSSMFREGTMDQLPKEQQQKFMDNIFYKAKKLGTIINDILRASEMDTEDFQLAPENLKLISLEEVGQSVYKDLENGASEKNIKFELILPNKKLPQVMADHDFLEQAIFNLVDNAIKYTQKGSVALIFEALDDKIAIKVQDTGIGIPEADKVKLFGKFNRAANAVDMYTDGSGLGLFIVKKIISAHPGGQISFESKEGLGTSFTITLPIPKK